MSQVVDERSSVDCRNCLHFQVTWDAEFPRGCRAMGFKSKQWPSVEVLQSSGEPCLQFYAKNRAGDSVRGSDETGRASGAPKAGFSRVV